MNWLLRTTHTGWAALSILAGGVLAGLVRGATASVPSLTQATLAPVPVVAALALIPVVAMAWVWSGVPWQSVATSTRQTSPVLALAAAAVVIVYGVGAGIFGGVAATWENMRDAAGLLGIAVIGAHVLGERGLVLAPIAYLVAAFMLGRPPGRPGASPWAWILNDGGDLPSAAIATTLAAIALCLLPRLPQRRIREG